MSNVKVFKYLFTSENSAKEFLTRVNKETGGLASHPFCGKNADKDVRSVLVKGVGSTVFDLKLKADCDDICLQLNGWPMPNT